MAQQDDLVVVYAGRASEADFAKSLLEANGLTAFLWGEALGTWAPWYASAGGTEPVKVAVARKDADTANHILQKLSGKQSGD